MNLYEAIYVRKSVRNYKKEAVDSKILNGILEFANALEPLFPGMRVRIEIIDHVSKKGHLGGIVNVKAPYYLVIYSEKKEKSHLNAGYLMEQISLYMCVKGIGSCFLGMAKGKDKELGSDGYEFIIAMAFGISRGSLIRNDCEVKRLTLDELCAYKERPKSWVKEILEAARLAPSSFNSQPWRFVVYENRVHVFKKRSVSPVSSLNRYTEFNMGIMFANIMTAAEEIWVDLDLIKLDNITHKSLSNTQYVLSILPKI